MYKEILRSMPLELCKEQAMEVLGITEEPLCQKCNGPVEFARHLKDTEYGGFRKYCSKACRLVGQKVECPDIDKLQYLVKVEHMFYHDIAKIFGVSDSVVGVWCKEHNIKNQNKEILKKKSPSKEELVDLYITQKISALSIAKKFGTSSPTVKKWLLENDISVRGSNESQVLVGNKLSGKKWDEKTKEQFREKSKITNLEKRGVEHHSQTEEYIEKRIKTCKEMYGVDNTFQLTDRIMEGHIKKYGMHHSQTEEGRKIRSENSKNRSPELNLQIFLSRRKTQYSHNLEFMEILNSKDRDIFKQYIDSLSLKNRFDIAEKIGISYTFLNALFRHYNMRDEYLSKGCRNSNGQRWLLNFIQSIYSGNIIISDRTIIGPKELDIYIPEFNLSIEYNGVYYHSEGSGGRDSSYHLGKTNGCEEKNIQLLHVFDTEWNDITKREVWKSIIKNKMGLIDKKIYARKCELQEITSSISREFLDKNHLSGFVGAEKHLGLFYSSELISVLSYGKSRFKKDEYEIIRFASKINTIVIGAFGKFFKYLPKNIITYADRRISSILNCGYSKFFNTVEIIHPNWYGYDIRDYDLKHRISFQKHMLKELLGNNYDDSISVFDNMLRNGYDRIWDSGSLKFSNK